MVSLIVTVDACIDGFSVVIAMIALLLLMNTEIVVSVITIQ